MADVKAKVKTAEEKSVEKREKRLDCRIYPDCTRYPGSAGVLYLAVYPECLVQF